MSLARLGRLYKPAKPNGVFLLGQYAEVSDHKRGYHFSGGSAQELRKMLTEAGLNYYECYAQLVFSVPGYYKYNNSDYCTDWSKKIPFVKPKYQEHVDLVLQEIHDSGCTIVVAMGDLALFALTGKKSSHTWRGSCLTANVLGRTVKVIATYAPDRILKVWDWRHLAVYDLTRVENESHSPTYTDPQWDFKIRPDFDMAHNWLVGVLLKLETKPMILSHDVETIARNISCDGIAISRTDALCIPWMTRDAGRGEIEHNYWTVKEETELKVLVQKLLTHKNAKVVGQNYLYDCQHGAKSCGYYPNVWMDTMLAWHTVFPGEKKSLDMLASLFCDHYVYWKDELKDYNSYPADEDEYWTYNCKDVVYTYEIAEKVDKLVDEAGQREQYEFQMEMYQPVFHAMLRGTRIDLKLRAQLSLELHDTSMQLERRLLAMTGDFHPEDSKATTYWFNSPQQCNAFFYEYLGLKKQINRASKRPSTDTEALGKIALEEPLMRPIVTSIMELRSVNIFRKNFIEAPLGNDNRIRCSYNIAGTATFRLASSKDAFGQGANLQTIPSGN